MFQDGVDWGSARAGGIEFAYIKATEGVGYVDPVCDRQLSGARSAGVLPGLYHFARPDTNSPESDAEHFGTQLGIRGMAQPGALPPCLDLERDAPVNMIGWAQRFIVRLREVTGYAPVMLYASTTWWNNQLGGGAWLDDQTWGWTAHYGLEAGNPGYNSARTVMHQYTDAGRIAGYGSDIDRNLCWGDLSVLSQGGAPAPVVAAPVIDERPDGWVTVRSGDSLSLIGERVGVAWRDIAAWNGLSEPYTIYPDQRLRLTPPGGAPGVDGGTTVVQPGETLSVIATRLGVDWHVLWDLNRGLIGDNPDYVQAGWVLATPSGSGGGRIYIVQSGDSLSLIGEQLGVPWRDIAALNGINGPEYTIYPGQSLRY